MRGTHGTDTGSFSWSLRAESVPNICFFDTKLGPVQGAAYVFSSWQGEALCSETGPRAPNFCLALGVADCFALDFLDCSQEFAAVYICLGMMSSLSSLRLTLSYS